MTVFVAFLAAVLAVELAATARVMWLHDHDHGRHRPHTIHGHHTPIRLHTPVAIPRRWT